MKKLKQFKWFKRFNYFMPSKSFMWLIYFKHSLCSRYDVLYKRFQLSKYFLCFKYLSTPSVTSAWHASNSPSLWACLKLFEASTVKFDERKVAHKKKESVCANDQKLIPFNTRILRIVHKNASVLNTCMVSKKMVGALPMVMGIVS